MDGAVGCPKLLQLKVCWGPQQEKAIPSPETSSKLHPGLQDVAFARPKHGSKGQLEPIKSQTHCTRQGTASGLNPQKKQERSNGKRWEEQGFVAWAPPLLLQKQGSAELCACIIHRLKTLTIYLDPPFGWNKCRWKNCGWNVGRHLWKTPSWKINAVAQQKCRQSDWEWIMIFQCMC